NREMATVIEAICVDGESLSPMIIYKAEGFRVGWFNPTIPFPDDVLCGYSPNGWTDNEMGLGYLKHHFGPESQSAKKAQGKYRMIIFDGYESHVSQGFLQYCIDHHIIACCLPPHSTNL
ncbi:CENP-B protein, partial [Choiromyces venosus 120613-1]